MNRLAAATAIFLLALPTASSVAGPPDAGGVAGPSLEITSPADGATSSSASVIATGTASDSTGLKSVTVDGDPVAVASDGSWNAPVQLHDGANTITAVATNREGASTRRQVTVNYEAGLSLQALAAPHASGATVSVKLRCSGGPCNGVLRLRSRELIRNRKLVAVTARRRTLIVGSKPFTIASGDTQTVTVSLGPTGLRLLHRFGRLPVRLLIDSSSPEIRTGVMTLTRRHRGG
jgi:hypothetical protein